MDVAGLVYNLVQPLIGDLTFENGSPSNAVTLGGEPLTLAGETLTLG